VVALDGCNRAAYPWIVRREEADKGDEQQVSAIRMLMTLA
jgi:hypothetical protein